MDHLDETGSKKSSEAQREFQLPPTCLGSELCQIYLVLNLKMGRKAAGCLSLCVSDGKRVALFFVLEYQKRRVGLPLTLAPHN